MNKDIPTLTSMHLQTHSLFTRKYFYCSKTPSGYKRLTNSSGRVLPCHLCCACGGEALLRDAVPLCCVQPCHSATCSSAPLGSARPCRSASRGRAALLHAALPLCNVQPYRSAVCSGAALQRVAELLCRVMPCRSAARARVV